MEGFVYALIIAVIFFLPTIIAFSRNGTNKGGVLLLNLFLGWTGIVWIIAFIWSFTGKTYDEVKREKEMYEKIVKN